tara:strand:- start:503 stop:1243 length:741 start_codon:yes stop_codon:yes gene_type:complete
MEPAKVFNNVIIGQFVLTGVPVKVYVGGRYLIITEADDVEDSTYGFGMDEDGDMQQFDYFAVEHLMVSGNVIDLDFYNKGMGATEEEPKEEPKEEEPKEESIMPSIKDILAEISQEEVDAEVEGAEAEMDSAKAKLKAAQAAMKNTIKKSKEKIKAAKSQPIDEIVNEDHHYTFGVGDIVKNKNSSCPHHGSIGVVKKVMELPNDMGTVAIYTVMNSGSTYRPGDSLTKTIDQLEPITAIDSSEEE